MSTARRRPTGSTRKPQVAGRPRTAAGSTGDSEQTTEGGLAVDERTDERTADRAPSAPAETSGLDSPRSRTVSRPGARPSDDEPAPAAEPEGGTAEPSTDATEKPADGELPSAPAVRSGESDPDTESRTSGLASRLRRIPLPQAPATRRGTAALLAITILLVAAAGFFAVSWGRLQFSGATSNTALTDVGATATVSEQVNEAVTKVYSFDFARLDQAESDARGVITGPFTGQFDQIFGNVRQLAPKQQAVVTATIPKSAVASIDGDHATVYVFVNQVVRRVDDGGKPQQGTAAARLRVDADYVDGRWKVSGMTPA
jgi:Mce-associated membrane protein